MGEVDVGLKWPGLSEKAGLLKPDKWTCVVAKGEGDPGGEWGAAAQRGRKCWPEQVGHKGWGPKFKKRREPDQKGVPAIFWLRNSG